MRECDMACNHSGVFAEARVVKGPLITGSVNLREPHPKLSLPEALKPLLNS